MLKLPREPPTFLRSYNIYKRAKEIMELNYRINITFLETRKIIESNTNDNIYFPLAQKVCLISNNNN